MALKVSLADNPDFQKILSVMPTRTDGRRDNEPRPLNITLNYTMHAEGSVLVETGNTKVICTASVENKLPVFLRGEGKGGWLTAEYGMLPRSTGVRKNRESSQGKIEGRTQEIQRLIGRSLRSVVDLSVLGDRTIWIDCDVIQADGGTRTAAISGGFVALVLALRKLYEHRPDKFPIQQYLAAMSVGIVNGRVMLDLKYDEDSAAEVDLNLVMRGDGAMIEVQGTAERQAFSREQLNQMLDYGQAGISQWIEVQKKVLGGVLMPR